MIKTMNVVEKKGEKVGAEVWNNNKLDIYSDHPYNVCEIWRIWIYI